LRRGRDPRSGTGRPPRSRGAPTRSAQRCNASRSHSPPGSTRGPRRASRHRLPRPHRRLRGADRTARPEPHQATPSGHPTQRRTARWWLADDGPRVHLGAGADGHPARDDDVGVETDAVLERDVGPDDAVRTDGDGLTDTAGLDDGRRVRARDCQPDASCPVHRPAVSHSGPRSIGLRGAHGRRFGPPLDVSVERTHRTSHRRVAGRGWRRAARRAGPGRSGRGRRVPGQARPSRGRC
jgi:hypothetical protein